jgi:hypothetical protein
MFPFLKSNENQVSVLIDARGFEIHAVPLFNYPR